MSTIVSGKIKALTDKAVLLDFDEERDPVWIPLSVIEDDQELIIGDEIDLEVKTWFAEKEELT